MHISPFICIARNKRAIDDIEQVLASINSDPTDGVKQRMNGTGQREVMRCGDNPAPLLGDDGTLLGASEGVNSALGSGASAKGEAPLQAAQCGHFGVMACLMLSEDSQ